MMEHSKQGTSNIEDTKPIDALATRAWSGTHWHYPHIETMISELTRLRQRVEELEREHNQIRNEVLRWVADKLGCACPTYHNIEQQIKRLTTERDEARNLIGNIGAAVHYGLEPKSADAARYLALVKAALTRHAEGKQT